MDHSGEGHFCQSILMSNCSTTVLRCFSYYSICMYLFRNLFSSPMQQFCAYLLLLKMYMPLQPVRKEFMVWWMKSPDSWGAWILITRVTFEAGSIDFLSLPCETAKIIDGVEVVNEQKWKPSMISEYLRYLFLVSQRFPTQPAFRLWSATGKVRCGSTMTFHGWWFVWQKTSCNEFEGIYQANIWAIQSTHPY